jgi:hypothetical protein
VPGEKGQKCLSKKRSRIRWSELLFESCGVNEFADCRYAISGETEAAGMLPYDVFIWSEIDAVDFVFRNVAVKPLNVRAQFLQYLQRSQRDIPKLGFGQFSGAGYVAFDNELGHSAVNIPRMAARPAQLLLRSRLAGHDGKWSGRVDLNHRPPGPEPH